MAIVSVKIEDSKVALLREKASGFGLSLEQFIIASIEDLIAYPDPQFKEAMHRVLLKNKELYERLS